MWGRAAYSAGCVHPNELVASSNPLICLLHTASLPADAAPTSLQAVRLHGMGPKLLLSDRSTADQPTIRWRLRVKGNTAVEFGVIPIALEVR